MPELKGTPLGLVNAQASLRQLATASPEVREELLVHIDKSLNWAERVLNGSAAPPDAAHYLDLVRQARDELRQHQPAGVQPEQPAVRAAESAVVADDEADADEDATSTRLPAGWWREAVRHQRAVRQIHLAAHASHFHNPLFVTVLMDDARCRDLAQYAKGALDLAVRMVKLPGPAAPLEVDLLEDYRSPDQLQRWLQERLSVTERLRITRLFLCMNSEVSHEELRRTLAGIEALPRLEDHAVLLDSSSNDYVAEFAERNQFAYQPHANPGLAGWINDVMVGGR